MKKCTKCGVEKEINEFYKDKTHKNGLYPSCKDCVLKYSSEYRKLNKLTLSIKQSAYSKSKRGKEVIKKYKESGKQNIAIKKYINKNPERKWASGTLSSHRNKGKCKINITLDELTNLAILSRHCTYCGIELNWSVFTKGIAQHNSPSLDRVRAEKTISKDNIAIVCHKCNGAKNSGTFEELLEYAKRLLKFQGRL